MKALLQRIKYALQQGWVYRQQLQQLMQGNVINDIKSLDWQQLKSSKVKAIVLDFDGVLAAHGEIEVSADVFQWLQRNLPEQKQHFKFYLLTNKPMPERLSYLQHNFPAIKVIIAAKKKPYPDGLLQIAVDAQVAPEEVLLIDDRLLTGGLAAVVSRSSFIYVKPPRASLMNNLLLEAGFSFLRVSERLLIKLAAKAQKKKL